MEWNDTTVRIALSVISGIVCSISMIASHGETGIGWFVFSLILIWGY